MWYSYGLDYAHSFEDPKIGFARNCLNYIHSDAFWGRLKFMRQNDAKYNYYAIAKYRSGGRKLALRAANMRTSVFVIGVFGGLLVICTCLPTSPLKKRYGIVCHNSWRIQELGGGGHTVWRGPRPLQLRLMRSAAVSFPNEALQFTCFGIIDFIANCNGILRGAPAPAPQKVRTLH